ncbi:MAG: hydantoinase B/oxoprolinase family protein [SAR324 cluster bacterium]|nr:hydantoinase B/oxoprolinase family protein [SAR324 cluster bacterium]
MHPERFRFSIDRGGTFTDVYAEVPGETGFRVVKLLSEDPDNYDDAPREGIRRILEDVTGQSFDPKGFDSDLIEWIRMGTTVATNALLERKGARTLLLITRGFGDLLQIGNQTRPKLFDLEIRKPELLYERVHEVNERIRLLCENEAPGSREVVKGTTGEDFLILEKPDLKEIEALLQNAYQEGFRSVAVVFMHAYAFADHEKTVGDVAAKVGFSQISLSHEVMPMVKIVPRGDTTMVDAYLTPHIQKYLSSFRSGFKDSLEHSELLFMQSDGGLTDSTHFKGSNAILSGPAGGVVGYAMTSKRGMPVIGFDMGGTSTDVSRYGGDYELVHETETAGVRIQAPQMHIKTVAAGGGSRLFFRNGLFEVGPESAGAHPGPVCYRKGGPLAVTDANLILGRLNPDYFPKIFGSRQDQPLDREASEKALDELTDEINTWGKSHGQKTISREEVALGFLKVANEVMIRPIREISVMRGFDIKEHALACFGGAAAQHACSLARELGIGTIFIHRFAGILSAYGMGLADIVSENQEPSASVLNQENTKNLLLRLQEMEQQEIQTLISRGHHPDSIVPQSYLNLRYHGTDTALMIPKAEDGNFSREFINTYRREFGFELKNRKILVDDLRVRVMAKSSALKQFPIEKKHGPPKPDSITRCYFEEGWLEIPVFQIEKLGAGQVLEGPSILIQQTSTIIIEPQCTASITDFGDIHIQVGSSSKKKIKTELDPVQLSIFSNLFMSVGEQMGRTLQRTAISTNIKERLDFSCAIFDEQGKLVANAPHVPVHLGAMSNAVRCQIEIQGDDLKEGDVLVSNHPAAGGSHLPDITVITPVWKDGKPVFYVASRGHHADIGGISPGSMPPFSRKLIEEGACIRSFRLVENGIFNEEGISELLLEPGRIERDPGENEMSGARNLADNISDLKAQGAANQRGIDLLLEMVEHYSLETAQAYMEHIQENAEQAVRSMLKDLSLRKGLAEIDSLEAEDHLDDGSPIRLKITINRNDGSAIFDFSGTGPELWGNLNTPLAVTNSAILYSLRCLIRQEIPLNQGCLNPIRIVVLQGSLLSPSEKAAVVGGNVLTSQRVTDVIFRAFNACAASQGCTNNFTFGNDRFGYYETIGGGSGAGESWHGTSGVHTHMTNTRITDPEVLERRYPVMLREFSLRKHSGGTGSFQGGDGLVREVEFLEPLNTAILSERRVHQPYGLEGGNPGKCGTNLFIRNDGSVMYLGGKNEVRALPGERMRIETPGGGGFGKP